MSERGRRITCGFLCPKAACWKTHDTYTMKPFTSGQYVLLQYTNCLGTAFILSFPKYFFCLFSIEIFKPTAKLKKILQWISLSCPPMFWVWMYSELRRSMTNFYKYINNHHLYMAIELWGKLSKRLLVLVLWKFINVIKGKCHISLYTGDTAY